MQNTSFFFTIEDALKQGKTIKIALIGNPNSGKTTLFNSLTGLHQKTANFPGVTVEKKTGRATIPFSQNGKQVPVEFIDLPGCYSLNPKSLDEKVAHEVLCDPSGKDYPDIIVCVSDATNLKRSLFMLSQLVDLQAPVVLALNMMDIVEDKHIKIDKERLADLLGIPVVEISARGKSGIDVLKKTLGSPIPVRSSPIVDVRNFAPGLIEKIREIIPLKSDYAAFQIANNYEELNYHFLKNEDKKKLQHLVREYNFDKSKQQSRESIERYTELEKIIQETLKDEGDLTEQNRTHRFDNILTHPVLGYLVFLLILFMIFQSVFYIASWPMGWIENCFVLASQWGQSYLPPGKFTDLLINGVLAGLSGIVVFVPQIALLFGFIAILEDTGYMARVSFIMDKLLRKFGLNGRSIIPLISGVACAIPAIMGTRTISNWKERIITILVTPLMSCSARLPVYTLIISLIIPEVEQKGFFNTQGILLMGLYLLGFVAAIGSALAMKFIIKSRERSYFIMELPMYRWPQWSTIGHTMLEKVRIFLFDAGKIIIAISIILWVLSSHAPGNKFEEIENKYHTQRIKATLGPQEINARIGSEKLEASFAGIIGHSLEPAIAPLGFDWKIGIALVTSFAAREVFVGTMATIYSVSDPDNTKSIRNKMMAEINPNTGEKLYNKATGFSLLIFYVFAMQCMSTLAIVYRETKNWKWPLIQFIYMSVLAYFSSFLVYQLLK